MVLRIAPRLSAELFKQDNDYSCGVWALRYLLHLHGLNFWPTEGDLSTTLEDGTSHEAIESYLQKNHIRHFVGNTVNAPCLINYQFAGDGHYGVALTAGEWLHVFNPWSGRIDRYSTRAFKKRWFSRRYGQHWALWIGDEK